MSEQCTSDPTFAGWCYWQWPLGDGWLIVLTAAGVALMVALYVLVHRRRRR